MTDRTNKEEAQAQAVRRVAEALAGVDLAARCPFLGLPAPRPDGSLSLRLFAQDVLVVPPDFDVVLAYTGRPVRLTDRLLALHYLQHDLPVRPAGTLIAFRDLPAGQFYFGPFCSRSVNPLLRRIGSNLDLLRSNLARFDWKPVPIGDFAAQVHVIGHIDVTLVYHRGNDEFPPAAEVLFDACIKRVYCTEDVAVIASRICLGLL